MYQPCFAISTIRLVSLNEPFVKLAGLFWEGKAVVSDFDCDI